MVELMVQHGGRIDRFLGDGVLAVFGVPSAHEDDPIRAVQASIGLRERAAEIGLEVTVGVNTGRVYFGPVGSSLHEELTVMGGIEPDIADGVGEVLGMADRFAADPLDEECRTIARRILAQAAVADPAIFNRKSKPRGLQLP